MANVSKVANRYVLKAAGTGQDHVATESEERYQRYDNMTSLSCVFFNIVVFIIRYYTLNKALCAARRRKSTQGASAAKEDDSLEYWCTYCMDDEMVPLCAFCGCKVMVLLLLLFIAVMVDVFVVRYAAASRMCLR